MMAGQASARMMRMTPMMEVRLKIVEKDYWADRYLKGKGCEVLYKKAHKLA